MAPSVAAQDVATGEHDDDVPSAPTAIERGASSEQASASNAKGVRTTFERFEVKYWVSALTADRIVHFARPYLQHDPFSQNGKTTRNVSLYLDSSGFRFYELHASGAPERVKLRVRAYGDPPRGLAFFEVKRKVKNVTLKARATLPVERVPDVLAGRARLDDCAPSERKHFEAFLFLSEIHRVEPKVFVSSHREAFVSRLRGHDVRMTIDRRIAYQPARGRTFDPNPHRWISIDARDCRRMPAYGQQRALIELKFLGASPLWMAEMVARFELHQEGFSKYIAAVDHLRGYGSGGGDDR